MEKTALEEKLRQKAVIKLDNMIQQTLADFKGNPILKYIPSIDGYRLYEYLNSCLFRKILNEELLPSLIDEITEEFINGVEKFNQDNATSLLND